MSLSVVRAYRVECDDCGAVFPLTQGTQAGLVREARVRGWAISRYAGGWTVRCPESANSRRLTARVLGLTE